MTGPGMNTRPNSQCNADKKTFYNTVVIKHIYSGEGGRLGVKGATLAQYVAQSLVKRKPDKYENDPRAAILRHAKEAAENPFWIDPAYKK